VGFLDVLEGVTNIGGGLASGMLKGLGMEEQLRGGDPGALALRQEEFAAKQDAIAKAEEAARAVAPDLADMLDQVGTPTSKQIAAGLRSKPLQVMSAFGGPEGIANILKTLGEEAHGQIQDEDRQQVVELFAQDSFMKLNPQEQFRQLATITKDADEAAKLVKGIHGDPKQLLDPAAMALERDRFANRSSEFREGADAFYALRDVINAPSTPEEDLAMRDLAAINLFSKTTDPTSQVLLAEAGRIEGSKPHTPWGYISYFVNKLETGESLTPAQRQQMIHAARDIVAVKARRQANMEKGYDIFHRAITDSPEAAMSMTVGLGLTDNDRTEFLSSKVITDKSDKVITDENDLPPGLRP